MLEHGVGHDDEFAHGGDDGELGRLFIVAQAFVEAADGGVQRIATMVAM